MKRYLADTNIYGLIMASDEFHLIHPIVEGNKDNFRIYGFDIIRRELRDAPRTIINGVNIRATLLRIYDSFISKEYPSEPLFEEMAQEYYHEYVKSGGYMPQQKLWNDFLIVSCASIKNITIVISEDNATMRNELVLKAYQAVNAGRNIPLPSFIGYDEFKKELRTSFADPFINSPNKFGILLGFFHIFPVVFIILFHKTLQEKLIYKDFVSS